MPSAPRVPTEGWQNYATGEAEYGTVGFGFDADPAPFDPYDPYGFYSLIKFLRI